MPPLDSLTLKNRSRHPNHFSKRFKSKLMVKDIFLQYGGQCNAFATSNAQTTQDIFNSYKGVYSSYLHAKFGNVLCINN